MWRQLLGQMYFNPRSHEGSDLQEVNYCGKYSNFNPRSHEGSDDHNRF